MNIICRRQLEKQIKKQNQNYKIINVEIMINMKINIVIETINDMNNYPLK